MEVKKKKKWINTQHCAPGDSGGQAGLTTESCDLGLSVGHSWFAFVVPSQFNLPMIISLLLQSSSSPLDWMDSWPLGSHSYSLDLAQGLKTVIL